MCGKSSVEKDTGARRTDRLEQHERQAVVDPVHEFLDDDAEGFGDEARAGPGGMDRALPFPAHRFHPLASSSGMAGA